MGVQYNDQSITDGQRIQIQTLIKAKRDAAGALVVAKKLIAKAQAESAASAATLALLDAAAPIPSDPAIQGSLSPFATDVYTATTLASLEANLEAVNSVITQTSPWALFSAAIGPENAL
jgi:hypothetical protein